ncbi:MAG TPA: hypothetical protein VJN18_11840 [Polyangiaceae bacterium]|nr:hypothetical protein [Polyangiaceae bacterium]
MGKIIAFPIARLRARRPRTNVFEVFGELEMMERTQLKLFGACLVFALAAVTLLQLAVG